MKHMSKVAFASPAPTRHARLFELIRQENLARLMLCEPFDQVVEPDQGNTLLNTALTSLRRAS